MIPRVLCALLILVACWWALLAPIVVAFNVVRMVVVKVKEKV